MLRKLYVQLSRLEELAQLIFFWINWRDELLCIILPTCTRVTEPIPFTTKALLQNGANLNIADKRRNIPLHYASLNLAGLLSENGLPRNVVKKDGYAPTCFLALAEPEQTCDFISEFRLYGFLFKTRSTYWMGSIIENFVSVSNDKFELMLDEGLNPNLNKLLARAMKYECEEKIQLLIDYGAELNASSCSG